MSAGAGPHQGPARGWHIGAVSEIPETRLHPLVSGFTDAENYDRGRPRYGAETVAAIVTALELGPGAPVLELGAGTGQLSDALVQAGLELTAVEPLAETRALLSRSIGAERVLEGVAEQIPMSQDSVAAVLAADSFHWFDHSRAMPEIRRVLRPGGGVAILRSLPRFEQPWARELGSRIAAARTSHPAFEPGGAAMALTEEEGFGPVTEIVLTSRQASDRGRLLAYVASLSWIGTLPEAERRELLGDVAEMCERHGVGEFSHPVAHHIWVARLL